jgi:hypothetical protein
MSRPSIHAGLRELKMAPETLPSPDRVRRPGAGRKRLTQADPGLAGALEALVDPSARGDPMSPLRWTCKSVRQLAETLSGEGHRVSPQGVSELLHQAGYSLQANAKKLEGCHHADRDAQFAYLNQEVKRFLAEGRPVVSVDTKKKERVGPYKNGGREWRPAGQPEAVRVHDFIDPALGKAIPYGIFDLGRNVGWVNVGCDHDTSALAVESLRRWWTAMGASVYPKAERLLICADGGGSNGYRVRLWKLELQKFAQETGLQVTVCHLPPGTSKWNQIEHRLFSHISMNWRGRPLISHEVVVQLISSTTTRKGLRVHAEPDKAVRSAHLTQYPTQVKVTKDQMKHVNSGARKRSRLHPHPFHGEWNYTVEPKPS